VVLAPRLRLLLTRIPNLITKYPFITNPQVWAHAAPPSESPEQLQTAGLQWWCDGVHGGNGKKRGTCEAWYRLACMAGYQLVHNSSNIVNPSSRDISLQDPV
jgi:hypothetical protein